MQLVDSQVTLLCTINDDDKFSKSFKCMHSWELEKNWNIVEDMQRF